MSLRMLMLKLVLAPALIGVASWIGRRWGPTVGGWFAALPLTSGPVILIIALERGAGFAAQASIGTLLALVSLGAFSVTYGWSARWLHWSGASVLATVAYLAATWVLTTVTVSIWWAFVVVCAALAAAVRLMPAETTPRRARTAAAWDIPLRMALAALLVFILTRTAGAFGPRVSGLLTPFPVAVTILASFTQRLEGPAAAAQLLRSLLVGLFTFAVFFLVIGAGITQWNIPLTFVAGLGAAGVCHAVVALWMWRAA